MSPGFFGAIAAALIVQQWAGSFPAIDPRPFLCSPGLGVEEWTGQSPRPFDYNVPSLQRYISSTTGPCSFGSDGYDRDVSRSSEWTERQGLAAAPERVKLDLHRAPSRSLAFFVQAKCESVHTGLLWAGAILAPGERAVLCTRSIISRVLKKALERLSGAPRRRGGGRTRSRASRRLAARPIPSR